MGTRDGNREKQGKEGDGCGWPHDVVQRGNSTHKSDADVRTRERSLRYGSSLPNAQDIYAESGGGREYRCKQRSARNGGCRSCCRCYCHPVENTPFFTFPRRRKTDSHRSVCGCRRKRSGNQTTQEGDRPCSEAISCNCGRHKLRQRWRQLLMGQLWCTIGE